MRRRWLKLALTRCSVKWPSLSARLRAKSSGALVKVLVAFVLVRLAQKLQIDPDGALSDANAKFTGRLRHVLRRCEPAGIEPHEAGLAVLDGFWDEAKALER
mgnify:CR=1 FL=1